MSNILKIKRIRRQKDKQESINIIGIEETEKYKYLGVNIDYTGTHKEMLALVAERVNYIT